MEQIFGIEFERKGPVTIGEIHTSALTENAAWGDLLSEIRTAMHQGEALHLLLDFRHVQHVSIEFFGEIKALEEENAKAGGTIRLCCLHRTALDLLKLLDAPTDLCMGASTEHAHIRYLRWLKHAGRI